MSAARFLEVTRREVGANLRRPLYYVLLAIIGYTSWYYAQGDVGLQSGTTVIGGKEVWLNSEFFVSWSMAAITFAVYSFFVAVAAGMTIIRDDKLGVGEILHTTRLTPGEYVWGKFTAVLICFVLLLGLDLGLSMLFNHVVPNGAEPEQIGPFSAWTYLRPGLLFGLPVMLFFGGVSLAVGTRWRKPVLVFVVPIAVVMLSTFLWTWSPNWLDGRINTVISVLDPSGFRWLDQTYIEIDRGADFYNAARVAVDPGFQLNRIAIVAIGLLGVLWARRSLARSLRRAHGEQSRRARRAARAAFAAASKGTGRGFGRAESADSLSVARTTSAAGPRAPIVVGAAAGAPLARMGTARPTFLTTMRDVVAAELRALLKRPSLYLFTPLIVWEAVTIMALTTGLFDSPMLPVSGIMAVSMMNTLSLLVCALLLFYMVESIQREHTCGLAPIYYAVPARTGAILAGKAVGNGLVALVVLGASLVAAYGVLLYRGATWGVDVPFQLSPFLIIWGLILLPTFLVWAAFVLAVYTLTRSRYATYGIGLAVLFYSVFTAIAGEVTWVTNWMAWDTLSWSDMGTLELDRGPLLLSRLMLLGLAALFVGLAVRFFGRQEFDGVRIVHRLRPRSLLRTGVALLPLIALPLLPGIPLYVLVRNGFEGDVVDEIQKNYWRGNMATWRSALTPNIQHADLDVELEPERRFFSVEGSYVLVNDESVAIDHFPVTLGPWEDVQWSLGERADAVDNSAGLWVVRPVSPLQPGQTLRLGFSYHGEVPTGFSKNGVDSNLDGALVLPSSINIGYGVGGTFPWIDYDEDIGQDEDNDYDPRRYPDNWFEGVTPPNFGGGQPFTTRIRVTGPEAYTYNSTGVMTDERVAGGRRTVVWESDEPVFLFNILGGKWAVRRGAGTAIHYHPEHTWNIEEMGEALDAARRYYSEWFWPYPWRELRINQVSRLYGPGAQGYPTNTIFSEAAFQTYNEPRTRLAFLFVGHETAHQWWGNLVQAGEGPGGHVLHEGLSHFSALMLVEQVVGPRDRMEMFERFEGNYAESRLFDDEVPISEHTDLGPNNTLFYDKGGAVFWMLKEFIGRDAMLAGLGAYIQAYHLNPDHPLPPDFLRVMRGYAPDPEAFDTFTRQWFYEIVLPEYRLAEITTEETGDGRWLVRGRITNVGTGTMPVDIAATSGQRFAPDGSTVPAYRAVRTDMLLGAGEDRRFEIVTDFEPREVVVDPDVKVLQLRRQLAVHRF